MRKLVIILMMAVTCQATPYREPFKRIIVDRQPYGWVRIFICYWP